MKTKRFSKYTNKYLPYWGTNTLKRGLPNFTLKTGFYKKLPQSMIKEVKWYKTTLFLKTYTFESLIVILAIHVHSPRTTLLSYIPGGGYLVEKVLIGLKKGPSRNKWFRHRSQICGLLWFSYRVVVETSGRTSVPISKLSTPRVSHVLSCFVIGFFFFFFFFLYY